MTMMLVMSDTLPLSSVKAHLSELVNRVEDQHDRVVVTRNGKPGLRIVFEDKGPGIPDVEQALRDGFTSGSGMGLGLGGARRLVDDFKIETKVGEGTRITITRWR